MGAVLARSSTASFAAALRAIAGVDAVGAVSAVHSQLTPLAPAGKPHHPMKPPAPKGDPLSFRQWDMDQIHAPQARAIATGKSVLVGELDSGVDITHPDLAGQVNAAASVSCVGGVPNTSQAVWSNDIIGHGTATSGTIVAPQNGVGTVGVAPGAKIGMVKVAIDDLSDPNAGLVFPDAVVCGIDWAIGHNFDLINASLTVDPFTAPFDDIFCSNEPDRAAIVQIVRTAILKAAAKKITVIAASGNFFLDLANLPGSGNGVNCKVLPVSLPKVIGVSAVGVTQRWPGTPTTGSARSMWPAPAATASSPTRRSRTPPPPVRFSRRCPPAASSTRARPATTARSGLLQGSVRDLRVLPGNVGRRAARHRRRRADREQVRPPVARSVARQAEPRRERHRLPAEPVRSRRHRPAGHLQGPEVLQQLLRRR